MSKYLLTALCATLLCAYGCAFQTFEEAEAAALACEPAGSPECKELYAEADRLYQLRQRKLERERERATQCQRDPFCKVISPEQLRSIMERAGY